MNVFITGGSSGLGLELTRLFLADGHRVGCCAIEPADKVDLPDGVDYWQADVREPERMQAVIRGFAERAGSLDLCLANAGINHPKSALPDFERGRLVIDINVKGVLNTFEPAIDIMLNQGQGHLAAMGSIAGRAGLPGTACYGASKAAVINLCESLAIDLYPHNIRVTVPAPGFIATPLTADNSHKMPFIMSQSDGAARLYRSLLGEEGLDVFPWQMRLVSNLIHHMPRPVYRWLQQRDPLGLAGKH